MLRLWFNSDCYNYNYNYVVSGAGCYSYGWIPMQYTQNFNMEAPKESTNDYEKPCNFLIHHNTILILSILYSTFGYH